jgi:hypothetical protein
VLPAARAFIQQWKAKRHNESLYSLSSCGARLSWNDNIASTRMVKLPHPVILVELNTARREIVDLRCDLGHFYQVLKIADVVADLKHRGSHKTESGGGTRKRRAAFASETKQTIMPWLARTVWSQIHLSSQHWQMLKLSRARATLVQVSRKTFGMVAYVTTSNANNPDETAYKDDGDNAREEFVTRTDGGVWN